MISSSNLQPGTTYQRFTAIGILSSAAGYWPTQADFVAIFHRAASYVDQTLRGVRPGELPVQAPDKFTLSVNLKTAGMIGLTLPQNLIARADEVIE